MTETTPPESQTQGSFLEVLAVFTHLGLTSFGGPVAHLGYFHAELIERRGWLSEEDYADLVALCQFLPGPASSQVGIGLGVARAGLPGGFAAWLGFTSPSAVALVAFAFGVQAVGDVSSNGGGAGWLQGLQIVAVAVVAHALWGLATKLTPDRPRVTLALAAAIVTLLWSTQLAQLLCIVAGGLVGWLALPKVPDSTRQAQPFRVSRRLGGVLLTVFAVLLVGLPILQDVTGSFGVAVFGAFYRAGSLVFGGGHVVLPLLQAVVVPPGWVTNETFTAGYGAAQAVPGPLFTFSAFLGAVMRPGLAGVGTALLALVDIFTPAFLLLLGVLPFWDALRASAWVRAALRGVNAVVVGLLLAALYDPVWTSAIFGAADLALALGAFLLLSFWRWPAWVVVVLTALAGGVMSASGL